MSRHPRIAIIGLGYVGLPLAVALARHFDVIGYDIDDSRVAELRAGHDRTGEVDEAGLRQHQAVFTSTAERLEKRELFIITVPTPVSAANEPDLGPVLSACEVIGERLKPGGIVVLESTVYPGVTEGVCGPRLAEVSGLECGVDFFLGYSPERINPGDKRHTVERITKVIAGQTPAVTETLKTVYGAVTDGNLHVARDIRTAEAAKVIENAQRDINIAFVNEVAMICQQLGLSVHEVLAAAATKWNFLDFKPGLVGGHCIGVDPFYLAHGARQAGYEPEIVLAGRRLNDAMAGRIAERIDQQLPRACRLLALGLTFKENVPDLRNSKAVEVVRTLQGKGHAVQVHDPLADPDETRRLYGIDLVPDLGALEPFDGIVGLVAHDAYRRLDGEALARLLRPQGLLADVKGIWAGLELPEGLRRWQL